MCSTDPSTQQRVPIGRCLPIGPHALVLGFGLVRPKTIGYVDDREKKNVEGGGAGGQEGFASRGSPIFPAKPSWPVGMTARLEKSLAYVVKSPGLVAGCLWWCPQVLSRSPAAAVQVR